MMNSPPTGHNEDADSDRTESYTPPPQDRTHDYGSSEKENNRDDCTLTRID